MPLVVVGNPLRYPSPMASIAWVRSRALRSTEGADHARSGRTTLRRCGRPRSFHRQNGLSGALVQSNHFLRIPHTVCSWGSDWVDVIQQMNSVSRFAKGCPNPHQPRRSVSHKPLDPL